MSGHNKWSSIKYKKGAADAKRGKLFTRIAKEIIVAARAGGGDISTNNALRSAVQNAKSNNMPSANIERAIKRGTGDIEGVNYEEAIYEGYGHNGVAIIVEVLTDNKNRTVAEIRHTFSKYGGSMAAAGAVLWNFEQKGLIVIPVEDLDEDEMMMVALDAGAEDLEVEDGDFNIYTSAADFHTVMKKLEDAGYKIKKSTLTRIPKTTINADSFAENLMKLIDKLEDLDDTQNVYANYEISDEVMDRLTSD